MGLSCMLGGGGLGEFGNWPRNLGEGRGPRRLSDGEQSAHVCRPIGNRPAFQHHAGSPLQPPSPHRVGGRPGTDLYQFVAAKIALPDFCASAMENHAHPPDP